MSAIRRAPWRLPRLGARVPVRRQFTQAECGAACLAMVLSAFGRHATTAECREALKAGRDGVDALGIVRAARRWGLRPTALSIPPERLAKLTPPIIVHVDFDHFLVVERVTKTRVRVVDPDSGRERLSHAEFSTRFTGVAICFQVTNAFRAGTGTRTSPGRDYLISAIRTRHTITTLGQILAASALVAAMGLVGPALTKIVIDDVLPYRLTDLMVVLGLGIAVMVVTHLLVSLLRGLLVVYLQARIDTRLMLTFLRHVLTLPYGFFQDRSSGDLLMRLMSNAGIREMLSTHTASVLLDSVLGVTYAVLLVSIVPGFGALVVGLGALQLLILGATAMRMHNLMRKELSVQAEAQGYLIETLQGITPIKASGAENQAFDRWSGMFSKQLRATMRRERLSAWISALLATIHTTGPAITLAAGAAYVLNGSLTLGTMLAMNALAISFLTPVASLTTAGQQLQLVAATLERLGDVASAEPEPRREDGVPDQDGTTATAIRLEHVTFRYGGEGPPVLDNLSLSIDPGQKVAVVGQSGSGKSTLAKLLLGLYAPDSGRIRYDGTASEELDVVALRRRFGVVLQESSLFNGSIRGNIAFNDPSMAMDQVVRAAQLAGLHEDVARMPMGYQTRVSERGSAMSGGQQQRIALARALATQPSLLVLDEATSQLDVRTEHAINDNISQLGCTRVVIAHRLSTVRDADFIAVMANGRIVEQGTHEELLANGQHYAELIKHQLENNAAATARKAVRAR